MLEDVLFTLYVYPEYPNGQLGNRSQGYSIFNDRLVPLRKPAPFI